MLDQQKLVSVIIPTYSCGKYISEAIESVLKQSYKNFEIIIIDDGSIDNTKEVLEPYIQSAIVKYFYQNNKGPAAARNEGIKKARGEYTAFLDADDLWEKEKLAKSIEFMERNNFDWICTALKKTTMQGELLEERKIKQNAYGYDSTTGELYDLKKGLFSYSMVLPVHGPTMVIKRKCFEKVGVFDESFLICEDTDLYIRFQEAGLRGGFLNEMLTIYRSNKESITKKGKVDGLKYHLKVAKKHAERLGLYKFKVRKDYANTLWELAARYYIQKKLFKAIGYAIQSLIYFQDITKIRKIAKYIKREVSIYEKD